jgi:hypothetical protein
MFHVEPVHNKLRSFGLAESKDVCYKNKGVNIR